MSNSAEVLYPPSLENYIEPASSPDLLVPGGQRYLQEVYRWLGENHLNLPPARAVQRYAKAHDRLIEAVFQAGVQRWQKDNPTTPVPGVAILALGGYGRRELFRYSDIDLLLLMSDKPAPYEEFLKPILHALIDLRLDLGYVTRSINDCLSTIGFDLESATALIESRHLAGDLQLFKQFRLAFHDAMWVRGQRWFLREHFLAWEERHEKYESTVQLLEPNLKEGVGGLRDVHMTRWAIYARTGSTQLKLLKEHAGFTESELRMYNKAISALLRYRNTLHLVSAAKGDTLTFEWQPEVAERLGYQSEEGRLKEENMMQDYYGHALHIARKSKRAFRVHLARDRNAIVGKIGSWSHRTHARYFKVCNHTMYLHPRHEDWFGRDPVNFIRIFVEASRHHYKVSGETIDRMARELESVNYDFANDSKVIRYFLEIIREPRRIGRTLESMHQCRLLERVIPEFNRIYNMVRIDHYHHYTVDEHTLKTIQQAEMLWNEPKGERSLPSRALYQIERWDLLILALLLHDIGKGYGRGHALRGAPIAQHACERLKLPPEACETVRHLVLSHLKLNHASQRRDLNDPEVAKALAKECGSVEILKMLYVLSVCDLRGVSPDAWNDWKGQLLGECYLRTAEVFEGTQRFPPRERPGIDDLSKAVAKVLAADPEMAKEAKAHQLDRKAIRYILEHCGERYLMDVPPEQMARHFLLSYAINEEQAIAWHFDQPSENYCSDLIVCARDVPGLMSYITGALSTKGINVWTADLFSTEHGFAFNVFSVGDEKERPLMEGLNLDRLLKDLNEVVRDRMDMATLIERHRARRRRRFKQRSPIAPNVSFDNDSSQHHTLIEISAHDRPGILYQMAAILHEQRLNIHRAIINTEAYGVVDTFYVTDLEYNKIYQESHQERIREALHKGLAENS